MKQLIFTAVAASILAGTPLPANNRTPVRTEERLAQQIRRELVTLPYYSVFDDLQLSLEGRKLILTGHVTRPLLASSAAKAVKALQGVKEVENRIEVLPLSPNDDRLRIALYQNLFGQAGLGRYRLGAAPPVRIVVKDGGVTLTGAVINEMDRNMAGFFANQTPGAFTVTNRLRVER
jgi:hyperosmotically inducible protein